MPLNQTPASVSVVTEEDFQARQAATVGEVLRYLPNVNFGGGPRTDGELPTIRGYQGNDITILVDGARRNANYSLTTPLFIDPFFLSRAEVIRGASSSLYGSGGNGGAMVFTTVSATDLLKEGQAVGADTRTSYGSGDNSGRVNARVYGRSGDFDGLLGMGYQQIDNLKQAGGTVLTPNYGHGDSALVKLGWQAGHAGRLEFSQQTFSKFTLEDNNPQRVANNAAFIQPTHNTQQESVLKWAEQKSNGIAGWDARVYQTQTTNQRDPMGTQLYWKSLITTTGLAIQNTHGWSTAGHQVTYGVDAYQDQLSTLQGAAANPVNPDGSLRAVGLFAQGSIVLADKWSLTPSIRFDDYVATPANTALATAKNQNTSPKLALSWQPTSVLNLYSSYGQAFRAPSVWEMYMNNNNPGFRRFAPNPDLKPQIDNTFEIGGHFSRQNLLDDRDQLEVHAAVYHTQSKNLIQQVTIEGVVGAVNSKLQYQNVAQATRSGVEISGRYTRGAWQYQAGYSRQRSTDNATAANLFANPDKLTLSAMYAWPGTDMAVTWYTTAVAAQDYDSTVLRQRAGYVVHDLMFTWTAPSQRYRLDLGLGNILDKKYVTYQSSNAGATTAYEMGRNIKATLSARF